MVVDEKITGWGVRTQFEQQFVEEGEFLSSNTVRTVYVFSLWRLELVSKPFFWYN